MKPHSTSYENILEVENRGSQLSTFYKIMSPVQITLESCTGLGETDQYSIQMFSLNGCWLHENSMDALFRALSSRPLHRHDYFELMLVLEGEVIQQIEEKEYPYRAGTCCLVNRSILHNERFIGPAKLCFIGLSVDFVRSLTESAPLQLFEAERHLPENPVLQFMLANLGQDLRKEYQDLFPTPENTDSVQTLTTLIARMTHILHEPSTAATYYLKGALCELFDFLSSGAPEQQPRKPALSAYQPFAGRYRWSVASQRTGTAFELQWQLPQFHRPAPHRSVSFRLRHDLLFPEG